MLFASYVKHFRYSGKKISICFVYSYNFGKYYEDKLYNTINVASRSLDCFLVRFGKLSSAGSLQFEHEEFKVPYLKRDLR